MDKLGKSADLSELMILGPNKELGFKDEALETELGSYVTSPEKAPLPNELPKPLDLSGLPVEIVRSQTIEVLIDQNDDLMARLSVQIRKGSQYEDKLTQMRSELAELRRLIEIRDEQLLILKEKDRNIQTRTNKLDSAIQDIKIEGAAVQQKLDQSRFLHKSEAQKYDEAQKILKKRVVTLERHLSRHLKYRDRLAQVLPKTKAELKKLRLEAASILASNNQLKENISSITERFQIQSKEMKSSQDQIVLTYEEELKKMKQDVIELNLNKSVQGDLLGEVDTLKDRIVDFENEKVMLERKLQESSLEFDQESKSLQTELSNARKESKFLLVEKQALSNQFEDIKTKNQDSVLEIKKLKDQVESLQVLWEESQRNTNRNQDKIDSLQKLNQELSHSLNKFRRNSEGYQRKIKALEDRAQLKVREVRGQMDALKEAGVDLKSDEQNEKVERINSLLAEIEAGF